MRKKPLDPVIRYVAIIYGFSTTWDDVLDKWIIKAEESHCDFYWNSNESTEDFFISLKEYFKEIGADYWSRN